MAYRQNAVSCDSLNNCVIVLFTLHSLARNMIFRSKYIKIYMRRHGTGADCQGEKNEKNKTKQTNNWVISF